MSDIKLRKFKITDTSLVLETLNNPELTQYFSFYGHEFNEKDVESFIKLSFGDVNKHFAIIDENDNYMGTISLKNIDIVSKNAEYAIMLRRYAIGKGISVKATKLILFYAFQVLDLNKIYFNVISENKRAIKFYEKFGFKYEGCFKKHLIIKNVFYDLAWYSIFKEDFISAKELNSNLSLGNIIL